MTTQIESKNNKACANENAVSINGTLRRQYRLLKKFNNADRLVVHVTQIFILCASLFSFPLTAFKKYAYDFLGYILNCQY